MWSAEQSNLFFVSYLSCLCHTVYAGGSGLAGTILLDMIHMSWENSPNLVLGERADYLTTVDMKSCIVKVYPSAMT